MGLQKFNTTDASRGGRPKENPSEPRSVEEDAYTSSKDTEEYWRGKWDQYSEDGELSDSQMASLCDETHVLPRTAKMKLQKHGIHDFGFDPSEYKGGDGKRSKSQTNFGGSSSFGSGSGKGGFASVINNAGE